jgi:hypothetical protein
MAVDQMNIASQLAAAANCSMCDQRLDRNHGGRPVVLTSRRQKVLALLDEFGRADTRKICGALGDDIKKLRYTLQELKSEGKIRHARKIGREVLWELSE